MCEGEEFELGINILSDVQISFYASAVTRDKSNLTETHASMMNCQAGTITSV